MSRKKSVVTSDTANATFISPMDQIRLKDVVSVHADARACARTYPPTHAQAKEQMLVRSTPEVLEVMR